MSTVQLFVLLIFGALAAVVLFNLYAVMGRRIGRQPGEAAASVATPARPGAPPVTGEPPAPAVELTGLAVVKAKDPAFDPDAFLKGARVAYETIVCAFAKGDRDALKGLISPAVMSGFEQAMAAREAEKRTESVAFEHPPRADVDSAEVKDSAATVKVRFLAEFTSRVSGPGGESQTDRRTAEVWTFARDLSSADPNWILTRVDAAEA